MLPIINSSPGCKLPSTTLTPLTAHAVGAAEIADRQVVVDLGDAAMAAGDFAARGSGYRIPDAGR